MYASLTYDKIVSHGSFFLFRYLLCQTGVMTLGKSSPRIVKISWASLNFLLWLLVWLNKSFLGHCYMEILLKVSFGRKKLFRFYCETGESLPNSRIAEEAARWQGQRDGSERNWTEGGGTAWGKVQDQMEGDVSEWGPRSQGQMTKKSASFRPYLVPKKFV
jgi:hypothetical protein